MRKRGYTLSEVLVALAVVGFIAAMTIPTIVSLSNTGRRPMFRAAYRMLEVGVSQLINDPNVYPGTNNLAEPVADGATDTFCEHYAALINTLDVNCGADVSLPYSFISSNGMAWMDFEDMNTTNIVDDDDTITVTVDIDGLEKGQNTLDVDQFQITIAGTGKISVISEQARKYLLESGLRN